MDLDRYYHLGSGWSWKGHDLICSSTLLLTSWSEALLQDVAYRHTQDEDETKRKSHRINVQCKKGWNKYDFDILVSISEISIILHYLDWYVLCYTCNYINPVNNHNFNSISRIKGGHEINHLIFIRFGIYFKAIAVMSKNMS